MGKQSRDAGVYVLGLKDMAGLLKPAAARQLKVLKEEVDCPFISTHDTSGGSATILVAADVGVDAVDAAMR